MGRCSVDTTRPHVDDAPVPTRTKELFGDTEERIHIDFGF